MKRVLALVLISFSVAAQAQLLAATAANFADTLKALAALYMRQGGEPVRISVGSSGKLYAQIRHGAPYDLFFSADLARPQKLHAAGLVLPPKPYALGELVLWQRSGALPPRQRLLKGRFRHLSMANPKTAPYGRAALETLKALKLWPSIQPKLVRGENVGQAFNYVASGAAELGFVSRAQVVRVGQDDDVHRWRVPHALYQPITQAAVVVRRSRHRAAAERFLEFVLHDPAARRLIERHGYRLP